MAIGDGDTGVLSAAKASISLTADVITNVTDGDQRRSVLLSLTARQYSDDGAVSRYGDHVKVWWGEPYGGMDRRDFVLHRAGKGRGGR
jgi:hypothetical protein